MHVLFVGDVMLGRFVNEVLRREAPAYPWGDTLPVFEQADVRLCNLECALSDRGTPWAGAAKVFHFRSDAKNSAVLRAAHLDVVSLANNHALDYGYEALTDTLTLLDDAGIEHAGAGHTLDEAAEPAIIQASESTIGLLACTDNEPQWEATPQQPGVWYVPVTLGDPRTEHLFERVRQTKERVDFLIVSAHYGPNWGYVPSPEQMSFARALIAAGADVVFGHSAHVCRGIEIYQQRLILYSTGNFIDDYAVDTVERNDESCIFMLETHRHRPHRLRLYPTVIDECQARLAPGAWAEIIARKMQRLSAAFDTALTWHAADGYLEATMPDHGVETSRSEAWATPSENQVS